MALPKAVLPEALRPLEGNMDKVSPTWGAHHGVFRISDDRKTISHSAGDRWQGARVLDATQVTGKSMDTGRHQVIAFKLEVVRDSRYFDLGLALGSVDVTADNRHLHGTPGAFCLHAANFCAYPSGRDFTGIGAGIPNRLRAGDVVVLALDRTYGDLSVYLNGVNKGYLHSNLPVGVDLFWATTVYDGGNSVRIMEWDDSVALAERRGDRDRDDDGH